MKKHLPIILLAAFAELCAFSSPKISKISRFNSDDRKINIRLETLFAEWESHLKGRIDYGNENASTLCWDGILPKYSEKKVKILFIGREPVGISGSNYVEILDKAYKEGQVGSQSLNRNLFHRRMLKISYGLINDCKWEEIPKPTEMDLENFRDVSFAVMDYSKISNESDDWKTDSNRIQAFAVPTSAGTKNFWAEEIQIINPDIIISMNLSDPVMGGDACKKLGKHLEPRGEIPDLHIKKYILTLPNGAKKLLIDTYHFALGYKSDKKYFYEPIKEFYDEGKVFIRSATMEQDSVMNLPIYEGKIINKDLAGKEKEVKAADLKGNTRLYKVLYDWVLVKKNGKLYRTVAPNFKKANVCIMEIKLPDNLIAAKSDEQFKYCQNELRKKVQTDKTFALQFTPEQKARIIDECMQPYETVWHHTEREGIMQLVLGSVHDAARHTGGVQYWGDGIR